MEYIKIIPCLDVKDGRLVKGVNFVNLKDVGDPAENGAAYSKAGADELVFLDITATVEKRKTLIDAVKRTVNRISVPLTVGGGIGSIRDIQELMDIGVSKVSINTAAVSLPVIASGGAGTLQHLYEAVRDGHADAVLVASIAHFGKYSIKEMKEYLAERGLPVKL